MVLLTSYLGGVWGEAEPRRPWEETCTVAGTFYGLILCSTTWACRSPPTPLRRGDSIEQHVRSPCTCIQMKENGPPGLSEGETPTAEKQRGNPQIISPQLLRLDSQMPQRVKGQGAEFSGVRTAEETGEILRRNTKTHVWFCSCHPPLQGPPQRAWLTTTPQGTEDKAELSHFAQVTLDDGQHLLQLGLPHHTSLALPSLLISLSKWRSLAVLGCTSRFSLWLQF